MEHTQKSRLCIVIPGALVVLALAALLVVRIQARHGETRALAVYGTTVERLGVDTAALADVPTAENAAARMKAAAALLDLSGSKKQLVKLAYKDPARWSPEEREMVRQVRAANADAIELLHAAARLPSSNFEIPEDDMSARVPRLYNLLWGMRLLAPSARLHFADGEAEAGFQDLAALAALARAVERERPQIMPLVGIVAERFFYGVVRDQLASGGFSAPTLRRVAAMMPTVDLLAREMSAVDAATASAAVAFSEKSLAQLANQTSILYDQGVVARAWLKTGAWIGLPWREATLADLYLRSADFLEDVHRPYARLSTRKSPLARRPALSLLPARYGLFYPDAIGRIQGTLATRRLARIALAVAQETTSAGNFPRDLSGIDDGSPSLFCECVPVYRVGADGTATLTLPGAAPLWRKLMGKIEANAPTLFTWKIARPRGSR